MVLFQVRVKLRDHLIDVGLPLRRQPLDPITQHGVLVGIELLKGALLQLGLHPMDAQAVGQGGVDVHGLLGDASTLGLLEMMQGAHIVQAVGELDQHHPDVLGHGDEHLAKIFSLLVLVGVKLNLRELGDAVHHEGDLMAKELPHLVYGGQGVLHGVMQEPGGDARFVEPQLGEQVGDLDGVN